MGVNLVSIEQRYYLGRYSAGTVFNSVEDYLIDGTKVSVRTTKRFYKGRGVDGRNEFGFVHRHDKFELSAKDATELERIIGRIKSDPEMRCAAEHYKKDEFDKKRYDYFYAVINGTTYELSVMDAENAGGLKRILRVDDMLQRCETRIEAAWPRTGKIRLAKTGEALILEPGRKTLLEKPNVHAAERILAKNEMPRRGDGKKAFRRELLTRANHVSWNQVAEKF